MDMARIRILVVTNVTNMTSVQRALDIQITTRTWSLVDIEAPTGVPPSMANQSLTSIGSTTSLWAMTDFRTRTPFLTGLVVKASGSDEGSYRGTSGDTVGSTPRNQARDECTGDRGDAHNVQNERPVELDQVEKGALGYSGPWRALGRGGLFERTGALQGLGFLAVYGEELDVGTSIVTRSPGLGSPIAASPVPEARETLISTKSPAEG
ncbi:hypothetical protein FRC09_003526 [Ceratobasidium sp. 395]|nr:hypothetical protein FRC09_003526 [Ceratobasidium sp. 395]